MKTLFLLISVVMIFQASFFIASAQDMKLVVGTVTAEPGETIQVPITMVSTGQAAMVQFDLSYDREQLQFQSASLAEPLESQYMLGANEVGGKQRFILYNAANTLIPAGEVQLMTVTFTVNSGQMGVQDSPLELHEVVISDQLANDISSIATIQMGSFNLSVDADIKLSLGEAAGKPGDFVEVPVTFTSLGQVMVLQFDVSFDPEVLSFQNATLGTDLGDGFVLDSANVDGKQRIILYSNDGQLIPEGEIQMATLTWMLGDEGEENQACPLTLNNVILGDDKAANMTAQTIVDNGQITMDTQLEDECFIATASYGSKFEPAVVLLRSFRDQYLLTNTLGRRFVDFYYRNSPPIASFISHNEMLKVVVRGLLIPVIGLVYLIMHPSAAIMIVIGMMMMFGWWRRKKKVIAL